MSFVFKLPMLLLCTRLTGLFKSVNNHWPNQKCTQFATLVKWLQNKIVCSLDKFQVFRLLQETSVARSQQGECRCGCARAWIEAASGRVIYKYLFLSVYAGECVTQWFRNTRENGSLLWRLLEPFFEKSWWWAEVCVTRLYTVSVSLLAFLKKSVVRPVFIGWRNAYFARSEMIGKPLQNGRHSDSGWADNKQRGREAMYKVGLK